jgi:hypothetical protein
MTFRNGRVVVFSNSRLGYVTRKVCGLNRADLINDRRRHLRIIRLVASQYEIARECADRAALALWSDHLRELTFESAKYAGMARAELKHSFGIDWNAL